MNGRIAVAGLVVLGALASSANATPRDDLFNAVQIHNLRDVRRLVQDGIVDPNTADAKGDTVLIAAIRSDANRVIDYLVSSGKVSLEATNSAQETPLMLAAYRSNKDAVDKLLGQGVQVNRNGWSALHYAASAGNVDIVNALLARSADINASSPNRTTPLMMAARADHADVCRLLIAKNADPTLVNDRDMTAADFALRANDAGLATFLKDQAATWATRSAAPKK
jgi:ankyrin repeat protein